MITAVILAKNEEKQIQNAINSVSFCEEILVIDDISTDKTSLIAAKNGATILIHELNGDFAKQRNYAIEKAHNDWILYVDADEVITPELAEEIKKTISSNIESSPDAICSYYIKRQDSFWGRKLHFGELYKASHKGVIRLIKKKSGKWVGRVHEIFDTNKKTGTLKNYLDHYPHQSLENFLHTVNIYSTLRAKELEENGKRANIAEIILIPFLKFFLTYFILFGFIDGAPGFVYSFMMSFHSFLVRAKLYTGSAKNIEAQD